MKIIRIFIMILCYLVFLLTYPLCNYYVDDVMTCLMTYIMYVTIGQFDINVNQMYFLRFRSKKDALYYYMWERIKNTIIYLAIINALFWGYMRMNGILFTSVENLRFLVFNFINFILLSIFYYMWKLKYGTTVATSLYIFTIVVFFVSTIIYSPMGRFSFLLFGFSENSAINIMGVYSLILILLVNRLRDLKINAEVKI